MERPLLGAALASLQNGPSLVTMLYFNNRLQPCRISAKSSGTACSQCADAVKVGDVLLETNLSGAARCGEVRGSRL